ncbi:glycosyltransferase family 9 protein [bacterium]|nr:glycosyltransferase family 9 protein [bacterium]
MSETPRRTSIVVQLARFGDLIQSWPLISKLQECDGKGSTALVVDDKLAPLAALMVGEQYVIPVPTEEILKSYTNDKLPDWWVRSKLLLKMMRDHKFDQVINLNFHPSVAAIAEVIPAEIHRGARWNDVKENKPSDPQLRSIFSAATGLRKGNKHLSDIWLEYAGDSTNETDFKSLNIPDNIVDRSRNLLKNSPLDSTKAPVAVIVGSGMKERSLSAEFLSGLVSLITRETPVILIGTAKDVETADIILSKSGVESSRLISLCGKTDLLTLAGILKICRLTVGVDTGSLHLSAMIGKRCLGLYFGSMNFRETGPYGDGNIVVTPYDPSYPCQEREMELSPNLHSFDVDRDSVALVIDNILYDYPQSHLYNANIYESCISENGINWCECMCFKVPSELSSSNGKLMLA